MTDGATWHGVRALIEKQTGPIESVRMVSGGHNAEIAVVVNEDTFVKGLRAGHKRFSGHVLERRINSAVRHVSAPLRWAVDQDGWGLLGFTYLDGHHADFSPGSPDLPLIVDTIAETNQIRCPDDVPMKAADQRWTGYNDSPERLAGAILLHTDWNPGNVLISRTRAHLVDWAMATRGAAWIDPASWVVLLIAAGHSPAEAEAWASRVPSWNTATSQDITSWAKTQALVMERVLNPRSPDWVAPAAKSARLWLRYRTERPTTEVGLGASSSGPSTGPAA